MFNYRSETAKPFFYLILILLMCTLSTFQALKLKLINYQVKLGNLKLAIWLSSSE